MAAPPIETVRPLLSPNSLGKVADSELILFSKAICGQIDSGQPASEIMKPAQESDSTALAADRGTLTAMAITLDCRSGLKTVPPTP